jgi:protein phosphatase
MTGTIWRAILSLSGNGFLPGKLTTAQVAELSSPPVPEPQSAGSWATLTLTEGKYLDIQQRYQLLEPLPELPDGITEIEANVLDCQPLQPTLLEVLHHQGQMASDSLLPETECSETHAVAIPTIAQPYLMLQDCYPSLPLPEVHDAWEQNGLSVVLLQDRTDLPLLIDVCQDENVLPLQILHWLHEMVEHWAALHPYHYGQSLLKLDNLRVDREDYVLCLQRLYPDQPDQPAALKDLGNLWQTLFEQSQRTQNGSVFLLCRDLLSETITTVEELRSRIEDIASSMQSSPIAAPILSSPEVPQGDFATPGGNAAYEANEDEFNDSEYGESEAGETDDQPTVVLPMRLISLEDAGRTFTGRQRDHNEDCFYIQTESKKTEIKKLEDTQERTVHAKGLYILCDGMGGHAGGEVASALAVETLRAYFDSTWQDDKLPPEPSIREAIQLANQAIYDENQGSARSGSGRMGTTLVLLLLQDTEVAIAHVGDSRLYRFSRRRGLEQLTLDHEVGQREIQRGVEPAIAYARPDAYQLTQALGPRDENFINPDIKFLELNEDMLLLLCSDGMTDNDFLELHWQTHLQPVLEGQVDLEQGLNRLIEDSNQFNGHDNITGVLLRVRVRPNLAHLNPPRA